MRCKPCGRDAFLSVTTRTDDGVAEVPLCDECFALAEAHARAARSAEPLEDA
jgi:protein-arginine kinase activator protein McsA